MSTFSYSQIIPYETPEARVDQIGLAILREQAFKQDLVLIGDVTRTRDVQVYSVPVTGANGEQTTMFVEAEMAGLAVLDGPPVGRSVTWEAEVRSGLVGPTPSLTAVKTSDTSATLKLPADVAAEGGLIEIVHGLGGEVTAIAVDASAHSVNYRLACAVSDDTLEIDLIPGLTDSILIVLDPVKDN